MPVFVYSGVSGVRAVKGRVRAVDAFAAEQVLMSRGVVVDSLEERVRTAGFGGTELINFTRSMASLLRSGVPLDEAGALWSDDPKDGKRYAPMFEQVRAGVPLSDVLARRSSFPLYVTAMVRMGEATGTLAEAFERAAVYLERKAALRKTVVDALLYPAVVLLVAAVAMVVLFVYVLPVFQDMYTRFNADLPWMTRVLIGVVDTVRAQFPLLVLGGAGMAWGLHRAWRIPTVRESVDRHIYRLPVVGAFTAQVHHAFFCQGLGHLLGSGIKMLEALDIVGPLVDNHFMRARLRDIRADIAAGTALSEALSAGGIFGVRIPRMVAIAEQSGAMADTFKDLGDQLSASVERKLRTFAGLFEPILILTLAVLIGMVLVALYLPMFDIVSVME